MLHLKYKCKVNFVKLPLIWIDLCLKLVFKNATTSRSTGAACSCAVLVGNVSWMLFQEGQSLNLRLRQGVGQAAHTHNNPHVKCTGVYCAPTVNNAITNELYWVQLSDVGVFIATNTHQSSSFVLSCPPPFVIFCRLQLEHKAAVLAFMTPVIAHAINT